MKGKVVCFFVVCMLFLAEAPMVRGATLLGPKKFERTSGSPDIYTDTVSAAAGPAVLIIRNGNESDRHRVTSAGVFINNRQVLFSDDFKKKTPVLEAEVSLDSMNDIRVELRGKPGSFLTIEIIGEALLPPISLSVLEPSAGTTVAGPEILVQGLVANPGGSQTGITVNNMPAQVYGDRFFVNNLQLDDGENIITVKALADDGNTAETAVTVFFDASVPFSWIEMEASPAAGIVPFKATLFVDAQLLFTPTGPPVLTVSGPGTVTENWRGDTEIELEFTVSGEYTLVYELTDGQGQFLEKKIMVQALDQAAVATTLNGIWSNMAEALMAGDTQQALSYFVGGSRKRYANTFSAMDNSKKKAAIGSIKEIQIDSMYDTVARCGAIREESRGTFSYPVTFVKDENGLWKIMSF